MMMSITGGQVQARKPNGKTRVWVHYELESVSEQRVYMCVCVSSDYNMS